MKTFALLFVLCLSSVAYADDHIVIVFDTSGSMDTRMSGGKTRMKTAQDALVGVLSKVPDSTKVGILSFGGWIYDLQPVDRPKLEKAIHATRAGGGTPLYEYIAIGATRLLKERQNQGNVGSYKLLIVTDGLAGDSGLNSNSRFKDGSTKPGVLRDVLNRGIVVDAIGLDMPGDHPLSKEINGAYMRGDDPNSLSKAIAKSVAEVGFGGSKDASDEAFREIADLPEGFVMATLKGLTTFTNQPIGEKPPVEVIKTSMTESEPVNVAAMSSPNNQVVVVLGVVGVLGLIFIAAIGTATRS
jgi:hypothetical protein